MARLTANHPLQAHPLMPAENNSNNGEVILPFSKRPVANNNSNSTTLKSLDVVDESIKKSSSSSSAAASLTSNSNSSQSNAVTNHVKMKKREQLIQQLPQSIRWRLNLGLLTMPTGEIITLPPPKPSNNSSSSTATATATADVNDKKSITPSNHGTLPAKDLIFHNPTHLREVASSSVTNINNHGHSNSINNNEEESKEASAAVVASLLQYIEDSNALKLRCQRSRYEDLEKRHYYSNTIMGIANGSGSATTTTATNQQQGGGVDSTTTAGGSTTAEQSLQQQQQSQPSEAVSPISSLVGNKLHQVAPGDDPLSALLAAPNTNNNNGMFGFGKGNRQKKNQSMGNVPLSASSLTEKQDGNDNNNATSSNSQTSSSNNNNINRRINRPGSRSSNNNSNNLRSSDTSQTSNGTTEKNEETACKGSRWADYYSTREVLDVIEKDLNRLPNDHYTIYHEWKMYHDDDLARKRILENGVGGGGGGGATSTTTTTTTVASGNSLTVVIPETTVSVPATISTPPTKKGERRSGHGRQKNRFGNSFKLKDSFNFGTNNNNLQNSNNSNNGGGGGGSSNNGIPGGGGGDNKNPFWSSLIISKDGDEEEGEVPSTDVSRKERADRLSQLLFVYAREHPEIGYRQGMHETLSFILLALEMDLLEQSVQKEKNNWKRDIMELRRSSEQGGMAGVDDSGQIVTVRLLDRNYILHDAFALFECVMSALAPAYDAIPAGEEETAAILEKAKLERGESPMEAMVSKIMSKIRFVARDEALFGMVLCMPVPPQIYFAKWVRLMFGREISGGMKHVMKLWDAFFDLAAKIDHREEEITLSLALMNVLETAAASMIILIRDKLLKPSMARDGTMIGDPDPNEGIAYLMNYPPIEDIDHLIKVISSLLLKERSLSRMHERRLSEEDDDDEIIEDPFVTGTGRLQDLNRPRQVAPISPEKDVTAAQPPMYTPQPKVDVAESIGNFAAGLFDIGTRTVDAAISTYQKHQAEKQQLQNGLIDHPLQFGFNSPPPPPPPISQDRAEESMGRNDETYTVTYRNHDTEPLEGQDIIVYKASLNDSQKSFTSENGTPHDSQAAEFQHANSDLAFNRSKNLGSIHDPLDEEEASTASIYIDNFENGDDTRRPRSSSSRNRPRSNSRSSRTRNNLTTRKSPKSLALKLDKSVKTLMTHFELQQRHLADDIPASTVNGGTRIIPEEIWEAMAAIDAVKKELLTQDALETLER